ncbi:MAG: 30S ribosomal protein S20 [Parachlamydia sp.]|nr:30S ribosomal protein S20 [Parachlamydia sp.]
MAKEESKDKKAKTRRPSAQKRDIQSAKRRTRNKTFKATMRTTIRKLEEALEKGDAAVSKAQLKEVYSIVDKGVKYGIIKQNKANRTKARMTAHLSAK